MTVHLRPSPSFCEWVLLFVGGILEREMGELRGYIRVYSLERQGVMILYLVRCTICQNEKGSVMRMGTCVTCLCALKMWLWVSVVLYDNSLSRLLSGEGAKVRLVVSFIALFTRVGWGSGLYVRVMLYVTQPSVRACVLLWACWVCFAKLYLYVVMFWFLCSQVVLAGGEICFVEELWLWM